MRSRDGPLLALGCLGSAVAILAIVLAAASADPVLSGGAMVALGILIVIGARPLGEVLNSWAWPPMPWHVLLAIGVAVVVGGVLRAFSA
jgi:hypothetical protein